MCNVQIEFNEIDIDLQLRNYLDQIQIKRIQIRWEFILCIYYL